jgi:large subunit ribosomal protein L22
MSSSKARQVLDLIRGQDVVRASEILQGVEREAARVISKVLASAVANAVHNDGQIAEDLYVASAYADEGTTMKRWRPRARGRATRIRKRTTHITIIVARMDDEKLERRLAARQAAGTQRSRRVAESQRRADQQQRGRRRDAAREAEVETLDDENGTEVDELDDVVVDDVVVEDAVVEDAGSETEAVETAEDAQEAVVADDAAPAVKPAKKAAKKPAKAAAKKTTTKAAASDDDAELAEEAKPAKAAAKKTTKKAATSTDDAESEEEGK